MYFGCIIDDVPWKPTDNNDIDNYPDLLNQKFILNNLCQKCICLKIKYLLPCSEVITHN